MRETPPVFPGLNALRFFAAYLVLLHHAEQARAKNGLFNLKRFALFNSGGLAVSFFFVLSGFLITYLLLFERDQTGRTRVGRFYVRRCLRIWPLYYSIVVGGLFLVPLVVSTLHLNYELRYRPSDVLPLYLVFAPFVVNLRYDAHMLEPLWSIGVEEVFYLGWAPLFALFRRHLVLLLFGVIALKAVALVATQAGGTKSDAFRLVRMLQFEAMAIGGAGAYWLRRRSATALPTVLYSRPAQALLIGLLVCEAGARALATRYVPGYGLLFGSWAGPWVRLLLFLWLILNVSCNADSLLPLRSRFLDRLGEISYGIYMYHMFVATGVVLAFKRALSHLDPWSGTVLFYVVVSGGTIAVAAASKRWLEDPFLRLKKRFAP